MKKNERSDKEPLHIVEEFWELVIYLGFYRYQCRYFNRTIASCTEKERRHHV